MAKRRVNISHFILALLILSLIGIAGVTVRESLKTPEDYLIRGIQALREKNYPAAEQAFIRATQDGAQKATVTQAAWRLGNLYRLGAEGFPVNGAKAELFLLKAASAGFSPAQYELALMYDVGDKIPENREKAKQWMNLAAQSGMVSAVYGLGVWIERGYFGEPDMNKVVTLYEQAAGEGHPNAMRSLVVLYGDGFGGFPHNLERSNYWLAQIKKLTEKE